MEKVNISNRFEYITGLWIPKIVGELNGQHIKLVKLKGEFVWHSHIKEDELFMVILGRLTIMLRDSEIHLEEGEFFIVPRGIEHKTFAECEAHVLVFEPVTITYPKEIINLQQNAL